MGTMLTKIFGSRNQRMIRQMLREVNKINALEAEISGLTDDGFASRKNSRDAYR